VSVTPGNSFAGLWKDISEKVKGGGFVWVNGLDAI
jgi:hypothetical protein